MTYRRCGRSGLLLPAVSLGLWQNFGDDRPSTPSAPSCAEPSTWASPTSTWRTTTGLRTAAQRPTSPDILHDDFRGLRDELVISTKAGWDMWPGPYGDLGSRKYLLASLDQSLRRLGLDYVDIFYHHHFDPETPLEETLGALHSAVTSGKALYVGISSYSDERTARPSPSSAGSAPRCSSTNRRTRCSTAGSKTASSTSSALRASGASPFRHWRRVC